MHHYQGVSLFKVIGYALEKKRFFFGYIFIFLTLGILVGFRIQKQTIVTSVIIRSGADLLDSYLLEFSDYKRSNFSSLDKRLFGKLDEVIYSKESLESVFRATLEQGNRSLGTRRAEDVARELARNTKVLFNHYTNQYHVVTSLSEPIEGFEKVIEESLEKLNEKVVFDFRKEIQSLIRDELRVIRTELEFVKRKDESRWAFKRSRFKESYEIAQSAGLDNVASNNINIPGANYVMLGARMLKVLVKRFEKAPTFSRRYHGLQGMLSRLSNQDTSFTYLKAFTLLHKPSVRSANEAVKKLLAVLLSSLLGVVIAALHVLFMFAQENKAELHRN